MPGQQKARRSKHRAGKKVRARYERAIARTHANSVRENIVVPITSEIPVPTAFPKENPEQTFEEFLEGMEKFIETA